METSFCELREKEVINIADGKRLGHITDITFNLSGKIEGIVVPAQRKLLRGFSPSDCILICWNNIIKIGQDAILVELVNCPCPTA